MNNFSNITVFWLLFIPLSDKLSGSLGLLTLNDSLYAITLYKKLKNENAPSRRDSARSDPQIRKSICDDIATSGFIKLMGLGPIDLVQMYNDLSYRYYAGIYNLIYDSPNVAGEYTNPYRELDFHGAEAGDFTEHVFVCLSRFWIFGIILPIYVSKEYDISPPFVEPRKSGRFVFGRDSNSRPSLIPPISYDYILLVEEPAVVHMDPKFNVELYFLNIREYIQPAESSVFDPLCKLVSGGPEEDPDNQHYRFCLIVSRSSHYRDTFKYPRPDPYNCEFLEVSFKTTVGIEKVAENSYLERMIPCYTELTNDPDRNPNYFFISRAYKSNRVLVYKYDSSNGKVYLENLSGNVAIMDEINSFDFVED